MEIYPGFPAHDLIIEDGVVKGVITGDLGVAKDGHHKPDYHARHGAARQIHAVRRRRARLAVKAAWSRNFGLHEGREPQKFGIGLKELVGAAQGQAQKGPGAAWLRLAAGQ